MRKMRKKLRQMTMVVVRTASGELSDSRPCRYCADMLKYQGVRKVVQSLGEHKICGVSRLRDWDNRTTRVSRGSRMLEKNEYVASCVPM